MEWFYSLQRIPSHVYLVPYDYLLHTFVLAMTGSHGFSAFFGVLTLGAMVLYNTQVYESNSLKN
jgi:hypothetical protein